MQPRASGLEHESSLLTIFNTLLGRFCFFCILFRLNLPPRCVPYENGHDSREMPQKNCHPWWCSSLRQEWERPWCQHSQPNSNTSKNGIVFMTSLCKIKKLHVIYRCQFTKTGIKLDPAKIWWILDTSAPNNMTTLKSLLGMCNYPPLFIPLMYNHTLTLPLG